MSRTGEATKLMRELGFNKNADQLEDIDKGLKDLEESTRKHNEYMALSDSEKIAIIKKKHRDEMLAATTKETRQEFMNHMKSGKTIGESSKLIGVDGTIGADIFTMNIKTGHYVNWDTE